MRTLTLLLRITLLSLLSLLLKDLSGCPITGDSAICQSETVTYTSTTTGAGYDYEWNAFGGTIFATDATATVSWGSPGTGQVTLIIRDNLGNIVCTDVHDIVIHPNPEPFITASFSAGCVNDSMGNTAKRDGLICLPVCDSTWVTYSTPNNPGSTYAWTIDGSATFTLSTTNEQAVMWTGIGTGVVKVIETTAFGCIGETSICVNVVPKPNALIGSLPAPVAGVVNVCLDQDVIFLNNSNAGSGSDLWSYTWVFGDGETEIIDAGCCDGDATHSYSTSGTYTVMFIAENECHCKDTAYLTVVVSALPGPEISCISTVCPGTTVTYSTTASCPGYLWTATNGTIIGGATNPTVTVEWGTTGPGYLSLETSGCPGLCSSPTYVEVPIIPLTADIEGPTLVCAFECAEYSITCDIPIDSIVWHAPDGVTVSADTIDKHRLKICFYDSDFDSGVITVDYYKTIPGANPAFSCGGTAELKIYQRPKLTLIFPSEICDNTILNGNHFPKPATGDITWTVTGPGGSPTYTTVTQAADLQFQPLWTWGAGIFTITATDLDNNFCNAPQSVNVKVNPIPNAPDTILGNLTVCPSTAHEYVGIFSPVSNTLEWVITGGTPATTVGPTASILWDAVGPYSITIRQIDPSTGCKSLPYTQAINSILPLSPAVILGDTDVCANTTEMYSVTDVADGYTWSISPTSAGSVIAGQGTDFVTIEWHNYSGIATITLVKELCGTTVTSTRTIDLTSSPAPNMTVPSPICEGASVTMSTTTTGATFVWDFGDGNTATGSTVTHEYNAAGSFTVKLTATYTACGDTISSFASIMVNPKPNISISTPDPNIFCPTADSVHMFIASPAIGTDYDWYRSPSTLLVSGVTNHKDIILGGYYVIGTNGFGCKDTSNVIPIDTMCAKGCRPNPNYTADFDRYRIGCNQDSFVANLTGLAFGPTWSFDDPFDPATASGNNVTHTFTEPGFYRVEMCFKVPNNTVPPSDTCTVCIMKVDTIKYKPGFADSLFCEDGLDSVRLQMLNETKILLGFPTPSYEWLIDGTSVSSTANPILTLAPGTHTITLIVDGNCELIKTYTIPVPPVASFTMVDSICVDVAIALTNTSTGTGVNAEWDFGDGSSSLITDPNKAWDTDGDYTVTLSIANSFGCTSTFSDTITVLPNTLSVSITAVPTSICDGDSSILTSIVTGGYPTYEYLWNNLDLSMNSAAYFTGDYYLNIKDQYGCRMKSNVVNVQVNPKPSPIINGDLTLCKGQQQLYTVNYPSSSPGGYQLEWSLNGASTPWLTTNSYSYFASNLGKDTLYITVISPEGCVGYDTIILEVFDLPNVSIAAGSSLCEGPLHLLDGNSTSTNIMQEYWNTGHTNDSLYTSLPGWYRYTVVDSNSCSATASVTIHPLPDFCGLLTGCYEICDTVSKVTWYGPTGYAGYQWLYNGSPLAGAIGDSLNIPLYTSGIYNLVITTAFGCTDTSEDIDIQFVGCDCIMDASMEIECGPENGVGQTYELTFSINNTLGAGTNVSITSPEGIVSSISPASLVPGVNIVTATFTDVPVVDDTACFTITLDNHNEVCDTTICIELPDCDGDCESKVTFKSSECIGYDGSGNPMYSICVDVNWGGANGSTLNINSPGGTISPASFIVNNGSNPLCFNYTDLPSHSVIFLGYFNYFDALTQKVCKDTLKAQLKPCPKDTCHIPILGLCAHCKDKIQGEQTYSLEITINNTLGSAANVSLSNIVGGILGSPSPGTVPPGISTITIPFTDTGARDTIICFRVILNNGEKVCWADVCIYLPDCDELSTDALSLTYFVLYPNPSSDIINLAYNIEGNHNNSLELVDLSGKTILTQTITDGQQTQLDVKALAKGMYFVRFISDGKVKGNIKFTKL